MLPIIDSHLDLAWNALSWSRDLTIPLEKMREDEQHVIDHPSRGRATLTLPELRDSNVRICLGTVLVRSKPNVVPAQGASRTDLDYRNQTIASAVGHGQVAYYQELERQGEIRFIRTRSELMSHWEASDNDRRIGLILAMEGADPIVTPGHAGLWWEIGLRCVGLSHYGQGPYGMGTGSQGSITPAGRDLLREFEKLGMIVDLTHSAEPGFFEILEQFSGPVLASHNMCRSLTPGDRQFSDEQIRALIERGGVIGMAFDAWMLYPGWQFHKTQPEVLSLSVVVDHIDHICQIAGNCLHVGIGSDLDGGFGNEQTPHELRRYADLHKLEELLTQRGYGAEDIASIFYGNWLRFFEKNLP